MRPATVNIKRNGGWLQAKRFRTQNDFFRLPGRLHDDLRQPVADTALTAIVHLEASRITVANADDPADIGMKMNPLVSRRHDAPPGVRRLVKFSSRA